jgi:hypothetical protein
MTVGFEFYSSGCTSYSDCLQLVILIVILHREDQDSIRIKLGRLHFVVGFFGLWWGWGGGGLTSFLIWGLLFCTG